MSIQESKFLQWLAGICATLLVAMTIGAFSVLSSIDVMAEKIDNNTERIDAKVQLHKDDINKIGIRINEVKSNQTIMMEDIKDILKNMPK